MKERVKTAIVLGILLILILLLSHMRWVMPVVVALLAFMGVYELLCVTGAKLSKLAVYISLGAAVLIPIIPIPHYVPIVTALFVVAVVIFGYMMRQKDKLQLRSTAAVTGLAVLISMLFKSFAELRSIDSGLVYMIAAILASMITDTAAFFVGRTVGKHKLAPKISPSKTVEGSIGGIICTSVLLVAIAAIYDAVAAQTVDYGKLLLWALPATVIAQFGDLSMSVIKRIVGVKDFGNILPGHGGILDRMDSYLFVIPYTLIFVNYIGGFIG